MRLQEGGLTWTVPATVVRVIDADTVMVDLDLGWRVYRNRERIRVVGIDAPERGTAEGELASAWTRALLPAGTTVLVASQAKPSFERTIGQLLLPDEGAGTRDYAAAAVAAGHATSWTS